jgi:phosphohistidine swiveling domain-containing protein
VRGEGQGASGEPLRWNSPDGPSAEWRYDRSVQTGPVPALYADTVGRWRAEGAARADQALGAPRVAQAGARVNGFWYVRGDATSDGAVPVPADGGAALVDRWRREGAPDLEATLAAWAAWDLTERDGPTLARLLEQSNGLALDLYTRRFELERLARGVLAHFEAALRGWFETPVATDWLTVPDDPLTRATTEALWRLREAVAAAGPAAAWLREAILDASVDNLRDTRGAEPAGVRWLRRWDAFLERHGRRCDTMGGLGPSWIEDARVPLRLLQAYLEDATANPAAGWSRVAVGRAAEEAALTAKLVSRERSAFVAQLRTARVARQLVGHRVEDIEMQVAFRVRRVLVAAGVALAVSGRLEDPNDVVHLTWDELMAALHATRAHEAALSVAARRRRAYERMEGVDPPDRLGGETPAPPAGACAQLAGMSGAPGRIRGPARVAKTLAEAAGIRRGEILVTGLVTSEWAPVMPLVAGLVAEGGGFHASGAMVAADYGVPAVTGVSRATRCIRSGQWVEVDGEARAVHLLDS